MQRTIGRWSYHKPVTLYFVFTRFYSTNILTTYISKSELKTQLLHMPNVLRMQP
jgi:hypothetical protein